MSMVKDPGSAHNGMADWYWQRLSAVILAVLLPLPFILMVAVYGGNIDQQGLHQILDCLLSHLLATILIAALSIHVYTGLKVIIEDYVHVVALRAVLVGGMLVVIFGFGIGWLSVIWAWGG